MKIYFDNDDTNKSQWVFCQVKEGEQKYKKEINVKKYL